MNANPAAFWASPYDGSHGRCPIGEYHHGGEAQLIRHDIHIRELEARVAKLQMERDALWAAYAKDREAQ